MRKVIDFIIEQGLAELSDYPSLLEPLKERFEIKNLEGNEATEELITTVIFWKKHTEVHDSLEKFLTDRFTVKYLK